MDNIAFLELKYGNIYGGYPNYFVISDISLLVFEPHSKKIFVESLSINADVNVVFVNTKVNELGHTLGRIKYVTNLKTRKKQRFHEDFKLEERDLDFEFKKSRGVKRYIKGFLMKNLRKYRVRDLVTFDGRRDLFLCERAGVDFKYCNILDLQRVLNKECNYLFSLNKLSVVTGFEQTPNSLRSNNLNFFVHPIAGRQLRPKSAAYDAARLLMVHQEYFEHKDDFLMKAALILNKIQIQQEEKKAKEAELAKLKEETEGTKEEETKATEAPKAEEAKTEETAAETVESTPASEDASASETPPAE